ncbi:hypothetical protein ACJMK2_024347 [Sinanodonta woodiana]|uniref:Peptidase M28 domain-containing protein n=1 Tax=Sinanodonta woodiana TaxID=1069815 RepID=A0ABD3T731_SINWO
MMAQHNSYLKIMETYVRILLYVTACRSADISYMRTTIQDHFSSIRHHQTNHTYKESAKTFIYQEFRRFGLATEFQNFTTNNIAGSNIIGILKGKRFGTLEDRIAGICAHYDTVSVSSGVDDNGSGLAAMLEVARRASTLERQNTVLFISFDFEEDYLKGSEVFVSQWLPRFLLTNNNTDPLRSANQTNVHGFYVLDTIMEYNTSARSQKFPPSLTEKALMTYFSQLYNDLVADNFQGDYINSIYRKGVDESLQNALTRAWQSLPDPAFQMEGLPIPVSDWNTIFASDFNELLRSDHSNFWKYHYPALFLTDSGDYRGDMINCYHHACDNTEIMLTDDNLKFLGKQADALFCSLQYLDDCETPTNAYAPRGCPYFPMLMMTILLLVLI